jgi:hypothetical protein
MPFLPNIRQNLKGAKNHATQNTPFIFQEGKRLRHSPLP